MQVRLQQTSKFSAHYEIACSASSSITTVEKAETIEPKQKAHTTSIRDPSFVYGDKFKTRGSDQDLSTPVEISKPASVNGSTYVDRMNRFTKLKIAMPAASKQEGAQEMSGKSSKGKFNHSFFLHTKRTDQQSLLQFEKLRAPQQTQQRAQQQTQQRAQQQAQQRAQQQAQQRAQQQAQQAAAQRSAYKR